MVFLNVPAARGPRELFPYRLTNFSAELSLRDIADMSLREDSGSLAFIEARERIESVKSTKLEDDALAATVGDLKAMGLNCVRFLLSLPSEAAATAPSNSRQPSALEAMMAREKTSSRVYVWPADYPKGANQRTRDILNSLLGVLREDPTMYGGFRSKADADHADNRFFWRIAVIVGKIVPHAKTLSDRACHTD